MLYIQLIGVLAFCIWILSYYRDEVRDILIFQSASNALYFIHYLLLGALSGAYLSVVGVVRGVLFLIFKKHKLALGVILIALYLAITVLFYEGIYSVLPMCAGSIYLIYACKGGKENLLRAEIICASLWVIYSIFVHSYSGAITETILLISSIYQISKIKSAKK